MPSSSFNSWVILVVQEISDFIHVCDTKTNEEDEGTNTDWIKLVHIACLQVSSYWAGIFDLLQLEIEEVKCSKQARSQAGINIVFVLAGELQEEWNDIEESEVKDLQLEELNCVGELIVNDVSHDRIGCHVFSEDSHTFGH